MPHFVGLDIGGANLKAAHADGPAAARPFPVWKHPEQLPAALAELLAPFRPFDHLAVTMTAELADCFATKAEGVDRVLAAVAEAAPGTPIHVWTTSAEFVEPVHAREFALLAAAANWHALATWVSRMAPAGLSLLLDVGSTTADVIPLVDGFLAAQGLTDSERLLAGELVYTGVRRTPLCAVTPTLPFRGAPCPVAAELFATTLDAWILLGETPEAPDDRDTANGRPATRADARDRIARMVCCDRDEFSEDDALAAARHVAAAQQRQLTAALDRRLADHPGPAERLILSGSGAFLAERTLDAHPVLQAVERVRLSQILPPGTSESACAFAVARLAMERIF